MNNHFLTFHSNNPLLLKLRQNSRKSLRRKIQNRSQFIVFKSMKKRKLCQHQVCYFGFRREYRLFMHQSRKKPYFPVKDLIISSEKVGSERCLKITSKGKSPIVPSVTNSQVAGKGCFSKQAYSPIRSGAPRRLI